MSGLNAEDGFKMNPNMGTCVHIKLDSSVKINPYEKILRIDLENQTGIRRNAEVGFTVRIRSENHHTSKSRCLLPFYLSAKGSGVPKSVWHGS